MCIMHLAEREPRRAENEELMPPSDHVLSHGHEAQSNLMA